ncbi:MAG: glycosyltransferase family 2 protein [Arcticibacter sp.]
MRNKPLISVITVVFNGACTLEATIQSVLRQTYKNFEYIIIDGGSDDGTLDVIKRYEMQISYFESEKDQGIYDAMNKGARHATGDYVYFIGCDDVLADSNVLRNFVDTVGLATKKHVIYYGNVLYKKEKKVYDGYFSDVKFSLRNICHQAVFYPKEIFYIYKYELKYKYLSDYVLNLNIKADNVFTFHYIPLLVCIYNDDGQSANSQDLNFEMDKLRIIKRTFPWPIYFYVSIRRFLKRLVNG